MNPEKTNPNADLNPATFTIGKWTCHPFTLNTAIMLEQIDSPFMRTALGENGEQVPVIPSLTQIAETLYVILNWHDPRIAQVLNDKMMFRNEVAHLAAQITMRDFAVITGQLNAMMASLNTAVVESGIPTGDEKKDGTGPSA